MFRLGQDGWRACAQLKVRGLTKVRAAFVFAMAAYDIRINGSGRTIESADSDKPLLYVLRGLGLTARVITTAAAWMLSWRRRFSRPVATSMTALASASVSYMVRNSAAIL